MHVAFRGARAVDGARPAGSDGRTGEDSPYFPASWSCLCFVASRILNHILTRVLL